VRRGLRRPHGTLHECECVSRGTSTARRSDQGRARCVRRPGCAGSQAEHPARDVRTGIERITASHILVSYKGASRAQPGITRTKDEARQRAEVLLARIQKGEDFGNVARSESDDPTAKQHSGNLGTFDRFSSVKPFSDAAFSLDVNQVSGIVETEYGYHIIKRTG